MEWGRPPPRMEISIFFFFDRFPNFLNYSSFFIWEKIPLQVKKQLLPLSIKIKFSLQIWMKYDMILVHSGQRKSEVRENDQIVDRLCPKPLWKTRLLFL